MNASPNKPPRGPLFWIAIVGAVVLGIAMAWLIRPKAVVRPVADGERSANDSLGEDSLDADANAATIDTDLYETVRTAVASIEDLQVDDAVAKWQAVVDGGLTPTQSQRNLALATVLRVNQWAAKVTNPATKPEEAQSLRRQLPDAIDSARKAVEGFADRDGDEGMVRWMNAQIDLREAELLPRPMTRSIRREVFERLAEGEPTPAIGGTLLETIEAMTDPIDGLPDQSVDPAVAAVSKLSDVFTDNLYFALSAARLAITHRRDATRFIERSASLAKAVFPAVARDTRAIGKTPQQLVDELAAAVADENWDQAEGLMALWFNVLNGTELVKSDRKRSSPHPLDRLSLTPLRTAAAGLAASDPLLPEATPPKFDRESVFDTGVLAIAPIDLDLDGRPDLASLDPGSNLRLHRRSDAGFEASEPLSLGGEFTHLLAADLFIVDSSNRIRRRSDNPSAHDTFMHLVAFGGDGLRIVEVDGRESGEPKLRLIDQIGIGESGSGDLGKVLNIVAGDLESDGDLDLVVSTSAGVRMFANRGNRTFFEIELDQPLLAESPPVQMVVGDIDRDLDLDILAVAEGGNRVDVLENLLHLQFRSHTLLELPAPLTSAGGRVPQMAIEDVDGDVAWDVVIADDDSLTVAMGVNNSAGSWNVDQIESAELPSPVGTLGDFNNDGFLEWLGTPTLSLQPSGIRPLAEPPTSSDASSWGLDTGGWSDGVPIDVDGDGQLDVAFAGESGISVMRNTGDGDNHHLAIRIRGIDDNVSGRVNHYAIGGVLEATFGPHYRSRIITGPETHFGIGDYENANVRIIFPNGLTQGINQIAADATVVEAQALKGSCPYLYAYDGESMRFVTDCLWAAPLGLLVTREIAVPDRPWEYLKIDGTHIRPRGDHYDFRMTEELWEIAYLDQIELTAVDHPADVTVWTNEKVGPASIAEPRLFAFRRQSTSAPTAATDADGNEVTGLVAEIDGKFLVGFDQRFRQGLGPTHHVDLTFAPEAITGDSDHFLILTGWIMPTDTSLNIQLDQNPELGPLEYPSLWVRDDDGSWRMAEASIGFPGGKTKTMVVDVTRWTAAGHREFRIRTNAQICWDAASMSVGEAESNVRTIPLPLVSAEVRPHGFSRRIDGGDGPDTYRYDDVETESKWPPLMGPRTGFGEHADLIRDWDDRLIVLASGDEVRMRFAVPDRPLPTGWVRDFVMHNVGWDKDADLNTLAGQSTLPLPYRDMVAYPPPASVGTSSPFSMDTSLNRSGRFRDFWRRPLGNAGEPHRPNLTTVTQAGASR